MKKQFIKVCSMLLAMVMVFHILPMCVSAEPLPMTETETLVPEESIVQTPTVTAPVDTAEPLSVVAEIPEKRTEFSKEFLLSNGIHMLTMYPQAVHYATTDGWEEIDNTLQVQTDGTLHNTAGVWDVQFPQQLAEDQSISVTKDGYTLSFFMAGELTAGQNPGPEISVMSMEENAQLQTFGLTQAQTATAAVEISALVIVPEPAIFRRLALAVIIPSCGVVKGRVIVAYGDKIPLLRRSVVVDFCKRSKAVKGARSYGFKLLAQNNGGDQLAIMEGLLADGFCIS